MITRIVKNFVPKSFRRAIRRRAVSGIELPIDLLSADPWSSPNVWEQAVATYRGKASPSIFEYGCGCSSIHHLRNLMTAGGGSYNAVEHDRNWFSQVCGAVVALALHEGHPCSAHVEPIGERGCNFEFNISMGATSDGRVRGSLRLRPASLSYRGGEGSMEEFDEYIRAIEDASYDLVVVDGRSRKACVHHILNRDLIASGGTLALFEAGRGSSNWLGQPTLTGDFDYQPAVQRMMHLGGFLVDGIGFFSWPGAESKLSTPSKNPPIPMEACFLVRNTSTVL